MLIIKILAIFIFSIAVSFLRGFVICNQDETSSDASPLEDATFSLASSWFIVVCAPAEAFMLICATGSMHTNNTSSGCCCGGSWQKGRSFLAMGARLVDLSESAKEPADSPITKIFAKNR